ncbi:MAG: peptidoglycan-binding protein LysM [Draconibacterium sp.]|nr:MAG: peptidoglycan-binding protein LysM [Draconibacterium sp.]
MGLISFIKNAGAKIFGTGQTAEEKAADLENKLKKSVSQYGLNVSDFNIKVNDDVVRVWGEADSQEVKEKVVLALGNVEGVASVEDNMTVKQAEEEKQPEAQYYTVVRGDSLSKIAKKYYGNAMKYPVIFEANKPMLSDPDKIYPGQVLRIPPLD